MIRDAAPEDVPAVARLWNQAIRETLVTFNPVEKREAEIAAMLAPRGAGQCFLVAADDSAALGFARSFQFRAGAGYARTLEHTILLASRGAGQGRRTGAHGGALRPRPCWRRAHALGRCVVR